MKTIYLAGGMKGAWQDAVINALPDCEFIDPRTHGLSDEAAYTEWDLNGVRRCDVLFAFMGSDNPSGFGLALEMGYAKALGKTIIFVNERFDKDRYFGMQRSVADAHFYTLAHGINHLVETCK